MPDKAVDVTIYGAVYIPSKLLTGIVFPSALVENKYPHVTMMTGTDYIPFNSNTVLLGTCGLENRFLTFYE